MSEPIEAGSKLSGEDFCQLVRTAPLVAIDVVLRDPEGRVFLACRRDQPARGFYFVPGGRIFKNETIERAFARILRGETGFDLKLVDARLVGVFQHIYPTNRFEADGFGTHYVVLAYEIAAGSQAVVAPDPGPFKWVDAAAISRMPDVHPFTKAYFSDEFRGLTSSTSG